jgi:hypothetical protein
MRRGLFIGGIVLLLIGVALIGVGYYVNSASTSQTVPAGSVLSLTPSTIGSDSLSVSWSNAPTNTTVYLTTGTPVCATTPGGVVTSGTGTSGSFTASLSSGTTYNLYACSNGNGATADITYSATGFTYLMLIGIILAVVGALLMVLGLRGKPKAAPPPAVAPPMQ